jgi:hypothetical protein
MISDEQKKGENLIMDTVLSLREQLCDKISGMGKNSLQRVMKSWAKFPETPEINNWNKDEVDAINLAFKLIDAQVSASIIAIGNNQLNKGEGNE